jgi:hypothetical protein
MVEALSMMRGAIDVMVCRKRAVGCLSRLVRTARCSFAQFKDRSTANNVEIILPLPGDATAPAVRTAVGSAV